VPRDPGALETFGAEATAPETPLQMMTRELPELLTRLIPQNLTQSLLERDVLAVVLFSLFVGIAVVNADKRELTRPIVALAQAMLEVSMTVIRTAMRAAPVAVFGLMAETVASNGIQTLADLAIYCGVVLVGLAALLLLYVVIAAVFGGLSPLTFLAAAGPVQLLAFSTSSSAAVRPLTMKTAVEKLGVAPAIAGAVVPLASTVNMAGTALYQAAAIIFLAQSAGTPIAVGDLFLIIVTLTGASIGAPAAPGASMAILSATAVSFGVPLHGLPLILGVDRILDMARTAVNVTGDLVACRVLATRITLDGAAAPASDVQSGTATEAP
jgi:Na+/H+-dicarboxylate symporter